MSELFTRALRRRSPNQPKPTSPEARSAVEAGSGTAAAETFVKLRAVPVGSSQKALGDAAPGTAAPLPYGRRSFGRCRPSRRNRPVANRSGAALPVVIVDPPPSSTPATSLPHAAPPSNPHRRPPPHRPPISGPRFQARRGGVTRNASAWSTKAQNDAPRVLDHNRQRPSNRAA